MTIFIILKTTRGEDNGASILGAYTDFKQARAYVRGWLIDHYNAARKDLEKFYKDYDMDYLKGDIVTEDDAVFILEKELHES